MVSQPRIFTLETTTAFSPICPRAESDFVRYLAKRVLSYLLTTSLSIRTPPKNFRA